MVTCIIVLIAVVLISRSLSRGKRRPGGSAQPGKLYFVKLTQQTDDDIIAYLDHHIDSVEVYVICLLQHEFAGYDRSQILERYPYTDVPWATLPTNNILNVKLRNDVHREVIDGLQAIKRSERVDFMKSLIRQDMEYRRERGLLDAAD